MQISGFRGGQRVGNTTPGTAAKEAALEVPESAV
jgi:hypothetical protein